MINLIIILFLFQDLLFKYSNIYFLNILDEIFVIICFGLFIYRIWNQKQQKFIYYTFYMLLFLFSIGLISSFINQVSLKIIINGAFLMFKGWIIFLAFSTLSWKKDFNEILKTLKLVGYIVALFAIVDFLFPLQLRSFLGTYSRIDYRFNLVSVQSIFSHASVYGWFMLLISLIYFSEYNIEGKKLTLIKCIIFLFFAMLSQRFKILVACIPIFIYSMKKNRKLMIVGCVLGVGTFLILGNYMFEQLNLMLDRYIYIDYEKSARKALYLNSLLIGTRCFPFGKGFGQFGSYLSKVNYSNVYYELGMYNIEGLTPYNPKWVMDTYWPMIIGELGFIAMFVLIIWNISIFRIINKRMKQVKDEKDRVFLLFSIYVLIQTLCDSLSIQIFNTSPQYIVVFIILGLAMNINEQSTVKNKFKKIKFIF